ncbi:MAG: cupredoxin domain-containing protein [Candidatus Paceibacterota bacterium]|jgi:plastocyanin domain-containing protein
MGNKNTVYAILIVAVLIGGAIIFTNKGGSSNTESVVSDSSNVELNNGVQIISIDAKGGYWPKKMVAKAGVPTTIRFVTSNTFDCSRSLRLPSLGINKMLPQTGDTDIDIGNQTRGKFFGSCGMGMYSFEIDFS